MEELGQILDLISSCLSFEPSARPTIKQLYHSPLFQMDNIETINAKHFSQCILFYKAPSKAVRDRLFDPLRHMSAICLENPEKILDFY